MADREFILLVSGLPQLDVFLYPGEEWNPRIVSDSLISPMSSIPRRGIKFPIVLAHSRVV